MAQPSLDDHVRELSAPPEDLDPKNVIKIPRWFTTIAEAWCRLTGGSAEFTRFAIKYVTAMKWYNIDKARTALGYQPHVRLPI